jgi:uncharacterized protein with HEPN domain
LTRDAAHLRHILDAVAKIAQYTAVGEARFLAESHWHDATIRQLTIVGEATKRLSPELRARFGELPWRRAAGLRDVLVHDYDGVSLRRVWLVTQSDLPAFAEQVRHVLVELEA